MSEFSRAVVTRARTVLLWLSWRPKRSGERMSLIEFQRDNPGCWLAVREGKVIAARDTPHALVYELERRGIHDATVFRSPGQQELELVGLG